MLTECEDGLLLSVRVVPNAKREEIAGIWNNTHLKIALRAPAHEDKANKALVEFLATYLHTSKQKIILVSGHKQRTKQIKIITTDSQQKEEYKKCLIPSS